MVFIPVDVLYMYKGLKNWYSSRRSASTVRIRATNIPQRDEQCNVRKRTKSWCLRWALHPTRKFTPWVSGLYPLYLINLSSSTYQVACTQAKIKCQAIVRTLKSSASTLFKKKSPESSWGGGVVVCPNWRERNKYIHSYLYLYNIYIHTYPAQNAASSKRRPGYSFTWQRSVGFKHKIKWASGVAGGGLGSAG